MNDDTQKNAARVEEAAAAAESLEEQARELSQTVATFRLSSDDDLHSLATKPPRMPGNKKPKPALPKSLDDEWSEF